MRLDKSIQDENMNTEFIFKYILVHTNGMIYHISTFCDLKMIDIILLESNSVDFS